MKIKRILLFTSALCLTAALYGCGNKSSSSSETKSPSSQTDTESVSLPENMKYYDTNGGFFSFGTDETLKQYEGETKEDYEFAFQAGDDDTLIGILTITGLHQTAKGFSESVLPDYEDEEIYSNVKGEELTIAGNPAYRITADAEGDISYSEIMIQFGNGDLFTVFATASKDYVQECEKQTEIILNSVEFKGDPLKTEPETYENDYFSITAGEKWYFRSMKNDFASISLNLQNDISEMMYAFSFSALPDASDKETTAEDAAAKLGQYEFNQDITRDTAEYMGFDAEHIRYLNPMDAFVDYYIFEKDGVCYQAIEVCPTNMTEQYQTDIQEVIDNIVIK